ncbi:MAG: hypothetical protein ACTSR8_07610 [Promethearchaeota archaeon]
MVFMVDLFVYYWWIPLIYLGLGFILIGGCFFPIWNRYMNKFDNKHISDKGYMRLTQLFIIAGGVLLGVSWYIILMRNIYGMHPFIIATFMVQPLGQTLLVFGYFIKDRTLRTGTLGAYFLVILYACMGMIVIHDIFWCARRTDWYTHSWPAGEDLVLYATLTGGAYDYLIFGEAMVLQLILLVGASIALLYVLEKRLRVNPDNFRVQKLLSKEIPHLKSKSKSKIRIIYVPLLIFFIALFGFAISVDIIDEIHFYGELQYTLAIHLYLPLFCSIAMIGFFLFKREQYYNAPHTIVLQLFLGLLLINSIVSFVACLQLIFLLEVPVMPDLYKTLTSIFFLEWTYSALTLIFLVESIIIAVLFVYILKKNREI